MEKREIVEKMEVSKKTGIWNLWKNNKVIRAWTMYDWANSAFSSTIVAGFFPVFFKQYWNESVTSDVSTARLAIANSIIGLIVALSAPLLGVLADYTQNKKRFLMFYTYLGVLACLCFVFVPKGDWTTAILIYIVAGIGFFSGNIFYDSFLPVITEKNEFDRVSSLGFAVGYFGGGLLFLINVIMVRYPGFFNIPNVETAIKYSFSTVGIWWFIFSIPIFIHLQEKRSKKSQLQRENPGFFKVISQAFFELKITFRKMRKDKYVITFLIAYWLYIDGVHTVIKMAVDYGLTIGLNSTDLITAILITQFVGFPGAIYFSKLAYRFSAKKLLLFGITMYGFICILGSLMETKIEFYVLAIMVGLIQGGVQALSRSFFSRMVPINKTAEYFGFYNMLGKFAVILGPIFMALTTWFVLLFSDDRIFAARLSILSIILFFVLGGFLLKRIPEPQS